MSLPSNRSRVATAVAAALAAGAAHADTMAPDTSSWKCEQCPFFQGYDASAQAGVLYADDANASYGRYTGIDHTGAYPDVSASGQSRTNAGLYTQYDLENLGLPSREGSIGFGREGQFDLRAGYDGQPARIYDTTVTPYRSPSSGQLTLPAGWVPGNTTSAMTQLGASLQPVKIEYDRRTVSLSGDYHVARSWTVYGDFSHQEKVGTGMTGASFLTDAVQLPQPLDYKTDTIEAGVKWSGSFASARLAYTGSWFKDDTDALLFNNPYLPFGAGSVQGRLALPPGNNLQQGSLSGEVQLPIFATTLTYNAMMGRLSQDAPFLPLSTLGATIPQSSLDGDVRLSHYALALSSRPLASIYLRGTASYDGRDDRTRALVVPYVVTDTFPGGTPFTPRFGHDRIRLDGSADYRPFRWVRLGVGGEYLHIVYAPGQMVNHTTDNRAFARATLNPLASVTVVLKGGDAHRTASGFNTTVLPINENPLLRAYNYAPRDQNFFTATASWTPTAGLTWSLEGAWTDDAYRLSPLGLQDERERRLSTTVTWAPIQKASLYVDGSYEHLSGHQNGSMGFGASPWIARDGQYFWTAAGGGHWALSARWDLGVDYIRAQSRGQTNIASGGLQQAFPLDKTRLDSVRLNTSYQWTRLLRIRLYYGHEKYDTSDWALDDVGPATIPDLLALGAQPYRHHVNVIGLTARYQFGTAAPAEKTD